MKSVRDLLPTEGYLLLNVRKTTGRQLIIKTIEELILLGVIKIEAREFDGEFLKVVSEANFKNKRLKDYHDSFLLSIQEHYIAFREINRQNALTPDKLIGSVRYKLDFNDNQYKFGYIYYWLQLEGLVKNKFPFYYFNQCLTKSGLELKKELEDLLDKLKKEIANKGSKKICLN